MSDIVRKEVHFHTTVTQWWRGSATSPIGDGREIVVFGETVEDVRRLVNLEIVKEAHACGLTVGRLDEGQPA